MNNNTSTYAKVLNFLVNAGYGNEAWIYEVSADIARIFNPEPCDHDDLPSFDVFELYNSHRELMPTLIGLMPGIAEAIGIDDDEILSEFRFMVALKAEQELPKSESEPTTQQKIFDFLNETALAKNPEFLGQWALELANIFDCGDAETRFNLCGDFYLKHDWYMEELFEAIEAFEKIHTPQSGIVFETFLSIHIVND